MLFSGNPVTACQGLFSISLLKRVFRTTLHTLHTEYTLGAVFPLSGIVGHVHIHRANPLALSAVNAFFFIAGYAQQRKVTHRFQEYSYGADVFTECSVILKSKCKSYTYSVIHYIPNYKRPEHDTFYMSDFCKE